ncbi:30S ribosome-binding factor RbfA [Natronoglycomyces albus]|uniref:Ribosome-binding factor A n=1 Tax=Natronoglycomyces albus TaxID=2811108 RepID=A0A895XVK0_9ACTN|nr:30S ribosome-binding factor RbfA [Natronoglycomyces albus]QSB06250.1 30S ribosome-binding factor RbfA [Natronoglycomyces albus]
MTDDAKVAKVAERVKELTASAIRKLKDPRAGMITVTDARITHDLREATIFYTVLGSDQEVKDSAAALKSATGHLRTQVGRALGMRHTPSLTFQADTVPEQADRIEKLLAEAAERDAQVHDLAADATYAGEADPYRKDEDDEEDEDPTQR